MICKLEKLETAPARRPVVLCIMDGIAVGRVYDGNAVHHAYKPNLDKLAATCPYTLLKAHGHAVGMPSDQDMGNSEVGHNAIGSGRVFAQGAKLVSDALASGGIYQRPVWKQAIGTCRENASTLHFIGLLSDGNVHSHIDHLRQMITAAADAGIQKIRVHVLLDGRDVGETSALDYVCPFEVFLDTFNQSGFDFRIASGGGRMRITMDRYGADWSMVEKGWFTHVHGSGKTYGSAVEAVETARRENAVIDQDLPPFVIADDNGPVGPICDGDSVILFNFRGDRAIELCRAFEDDDFDKFERGQRPDVFFAAMTQYDSDQKVPKHFLVDPPELDRTMGEYLAASGLRQLAVSETQKFGHVTYFFNGNRSGKFSEELEDYVEVRSDNVPFEQRPWMKAAEITDAVVDGILSQRYDFIRLNYPNGDMVGHTGNFQAAKIAVEAVDLSVGRLCRAITRVGGMMIVTADHGNADEMFEWDQKSGHVRCENGMPKSKTCHTLNPVPCYLYDARTDGADAVGLVDGLGISSLAATCLNCLGYKAPEGYDKSLLPAAG